MSEVESETTIIGIGNQFRHDDAIGLLAARELAARRIPGVRVIEESGETMRLIEHWKGARRVILIDAVLSDHAPGEIHRLDAIDGELPAELFSCSTHAFSPGEAVELARALDWLPERLVIYGIEARNFDMGEGLDPEVEAALPIVVERIISEEIEKACTNNRS